jgi:general secretion pathway protein A
VREQLAEQEDGRSLAEWQVIAPAGGQALGFHHYYDPILAQKVANFQHQMGLKADRIIGLKTLLALQSLRKQETITMKGSL